MTVLLVDAANVVGSRPDGWWRDRAGAAARLLERLAALPGRDLEDPSGATVRCAEVIAVVEGQAREAPAPDAAGLRVVRAAGSGDDALVGLAAELTAAGRPVLAITADRGLRGRLPDEVAVAGPAWLYARLDATPGP